jgi:hypothetical protein
MKSELYSAASAGASPPAWPSDETIKALADAAHMLEIDRISADDRAWFKKNRRKYHQRLRRAHPVEDIIHEGVTMILVTELEPGMRLRRGLRIPDEALIGFMLENGDNGKRLRFNESGMCFVMPDGWRE